MRILAIAFLVFLLSASGSSFSATRRVPSGYPTIQAGIDAAGSGDTVLVAAGTYEIPSTEEHIAMVSNKTNLTLASESGKEFTILAGAINDYGQELIWFWHSTDCTLNGFTLRNGNRGIHISYCSGIKIVDCNIENVRDIGINIASECSAIEVSNNSIYENYVGVETRAANVMLSYNSIYGNRHGGIQYTLGSAIIRANDIYDNQDYGINIDLDSEAYVTIESNIIHGNMDTGLRFWARGNGTIRNNTISGNGIHGVWILRGEPTIQYNIIASNEGTGIAVDAQGNPYISCNDVWGNSHYANGNYVGYITDQTGYNGNISADPYFCNASGAVYSLAANSPALHASCGPMGAILTPGCSNQTAVEHLSWGSIKALYK